MIEQFKFLIADFKRWKVHTVKEFFYLLFEQGIWATIFYRFRRALYMIKIPILKNIIRFFTFIIFKLTEICLGVTIRSKTEIGPGLYIGHTGIVRIHPDAKIGKNLNIGQGVTIGERGPGHGNKAPIIGDDVYIGIGAKVLGGITIGNNVKIGANAVVISDLPDNSTAVGVPAIIVKIRGKSNEKIFY